MAYTVAFTISGVEALTTRDVNTAIRNALEAMGKRWKRRYLPKHFTHEGAREYGYKRRSGATGSGDSGRPRPGTYTWKKWILKTHTLPNVYTGDLRRQALYGVPIIKAKVSKRGTNAWVKIRLPRKANFRIHEFQKVTTRELRDLSKFLTKQVKRELIAAGGRKTKTKVSAIIS